MTNVIQKIIDNKEVIIGIRLNDYFYDVDYVSVDDADCYDMLANDDVIIHAHNDSDEYYLTVKDIKSANVVKLYKLTEI